jgi:hypothetical protein
MVVEQKAVKHGERMACWYARNSKINKGRTVGMWVAGTAYRASTGRLYIELPTGERRTVWARTPVQIDPIDYAIGGETEDARR